MKIVMKKRVLGKDLEVSAIGLGCMGMSHAYGPAADKKEMTELLSKAVDLGYTFYDTAEVYGRPETIKKSIDGSLKRLQTDHLDLYYIHRIDRNVPIEETAGAMKELIEAGKITHWGISEADEETLRRAHAVCPVTAVQNRYSMMYRDYEALFPVLEELNIGFVAFSPLANGFLTATYNKESKFEKGTDYRSAMPQFTPEAIDKNQEMIQYIENMAEEKEATPAQISLAWMLAKKPWIVPIPGTRKYARLVENWQAAEVDLTKEEIASLDRMLDTVPMSEVFGGSKVENNK